MYPDFQTAFRLWLSTLNFISTNPLEQVYNRCMRLPSAITVCLLLAVSVPLYAQRGGGRSSGGGHGGGSSSHGSFGGGGHGFGGGHSGFSSHASAPHSFSRSSRSAIASRSFNSRGFNRNRGTGLMLRTYGLRNNCSGYACRGYGYPWGYGGFYDPYWWSDSGSSYDQDQQNETGLAEEMNQQSLDEQRSRQPGDPGAYPPAAPPQHVAERTDAAPPTVLIFRDQHKQEVRNYAVVGLTLWTFDPQQSERIPLADLDLTATAQANDDRGVRFRLPGAGSAQ
jgi:hypothetical protein